MTWKIYALRIFLILYVIGDVIMLTFAFGGAALGASEMVIEILDYEGDVAPDIVAPVWGVIIACCLAILYLYCLVTLFKSVDRLVVAAHRGQLSQMGTSATLRGLGKSLILLWVVIMLIETVAPLVLFWEVIGTGDVGIEFAPFDLKVIFALVGIALWLIARLADEAKDMKEELAGVV